MSKYYLLLDYIVPKFYSFFNEKIHGSTIFVNINDIHLLSKPSFEEYGNQFTFAITPA